MYPVVEVQGLVNRFGTQLVHDGLDMEVHADEVFGIVGGSGTGKSVLLRTILGLQRPAGGHGAHQRQRHHPPERGRSCAASSPATVSPSRRARSTPASPSGRTCSCRCSSTSASTRAALDDLALLKIRLVGLPAEAAGKYPAQLSGGMIKRAALARALGAGSQAAVPR